MKRALSFISFKEEANLLDSKSYITKAFLAVASAYIISIRNPMLKLDTISVLFGLMLTLEPVNFTGLKNGLNQLYATLLGALATSIIIYFGGINLWTVALSVAFTLYICIKIDWRAVSPVAIFTSIYMTQYMQKTPGGDPSILLTFRLRIVALFTGVLIAVIFNYIFSVLFYRNMINKRVILLFNDILKNLTQTAKAIEGKNKESIDIVKKALPLTFNNIDWVFLLFLDLKKEYKFRDKISGFTLTDMERLIKAIICLRNIAHLNYDISFILTSSEFNKGEYSDLGFDINKELNCIIESLTAIINYLEASNGYKREIICKEKNLMILPEHKKLSMQGIRLTQDLQDIQKNVCAINNEITNIKAI